MGLKFLSNNKNYTRFDINAHITDNTTPLVIFPESTKTNRKGVLTIRSNLLDIVYNLVETKRILVWSEFAVIRYKYFSPNNTTEYLGINNLFFTLCQIYNSIDIYSMIIHNQDLNRNATYDRLKFKTVEDYLDNNVQSCIADPLHKNIVRLIY
jgi:hypothetical protein